MASVELRKVSKVFRPNKRDEVYAVTNFDLQVADKELVVLVGPSGCGKTTTLRLIAGLEQVTAGTISIGNIAMNEVRPHDRGVAMVFQRDALYPHMTVFQNMAFGLELRRVPKAEIETRVNASAVTLGVASLLTRFPRELSGGQRQRVALGRALVRNPKVFLLDEPLSNLDAPLRAQMRAEISRLHRHLGATMIYVTHDQAEAMTLGQRIVVMNEGVVQQIADPLTLYHQPANLFVAGFIGSPPMNLVRGRIAREGDGFQFRENNPAGVANGARLEISVPTERAERLSHFADGNLVLGLRPEHITLQEGKANTVNATVSAVERLGFETHVHFHTGAHTLIMRASPSAMATPGERLPLQFDMERATFFNPVSGAPIS